jgi:hypothetical protein
MDDEADVWRPLSKPREWVPGEHVIRAAIVDVLQDALDLRRVESALAELVPELPLEWRARLARIASERGLRAIEALFVARQSGPPTPGIAQPGHV